MHIVFEFWMNELFAEFKMTSVRFFFENVFKLQRVDRTGFKIFIQRRLLLRAIYAIYDVIVN
jgi:hypothetical protein